MSDSCYRNVSNKEARRSPRTPYAGSVRVSWEDSHGPHFAPGRCIDFSDTGVRIEVPVSIPMYTSVMLTTNQLGFSGSASVKHVSRFGAKYLVGLQMNGVLPAKVRDALRPPFSV